jgi:aminopeptidase S
VRRNLLIGALAAALLAGCASTSAPPAGSAAAENPLQRRLIDDVSGAGGTPHLEALQRIADANGGNRATPGPGFDASVDYVAGVLRKAGFEVSTPAYAISVEQTDGSDREINLRNVIAETRTGDKHRVVMAGAHLDSVPQGPGINDNGTGVAALLEIAARLGGAPAVTNAVRFGFWGAEEIGLDGSRQYVRALSTSDRERLTLYVNLDMLASPNPGYFVQGGVGDSDDETGPRGSGEVARVLVEQFAAAGVKAEPTTFDGESDYAAFVGAGIPAGGVLAGDEQPKSAQEAAQWGGRAGENFDSCYHSACDRIDNVDPTAMDHFTDAIAGALAHFAMSEQGLTSS